MPKIHAIIFTLTALSGLLVVALGAFGAHVLATSFSEYQVAVFNKAVQYQMFHTLALLMVSLNVGQSKLLLRAAYAFIIGIVIFSGSLYLLAITELRWLGAITPFGGVAFLVGWLLLMAFGKEHINGR